MHAYSTQGFIIVRTIQRPFFYSLYQKNGVSCPECLDYQLLPLLLWRLGLQANVEFLTYPKKKYFLDLADVSQEMQADLTAQIFHEQQAKLCRLLPDRQLLQTDDIRSASRALLLLFL